jgi:WD40 repeat protein
MRKNELCTASAMMSDGERMVLGRTEKFGGGTTIIVWDVLGNEPIRQIKCDASVGFADHISFLALSKDNRFVCAGFQNSYDQKANFIVFDLSASDSAPVQPKTIAFDALVDVTKMLDNHEAITGTRSGELIIWSMRTGKTLRQLVSSPPPGSGGGTLGRSRGMLTESAHQGEVKDMVVSKDGLLLVSASADGTLKTWDLESERQINTLIGHKDEVWCCTISNDTELIVSGSRDRTIRLWRASDGVAVAAINAGVDVFKVLLSNNKKTIVALADRAASRKLIMLKVVRNKTRTISRSGGGTQSGYNSDAVSPTSTMGRNTGRF